MDDLHFGAAVRAVRKRRGLGQADLARLSGVSRATVSLVERGHCEKLSLLTVRRMASALDIRTELIARWRGGELDRLLSRRHSMLAESFAAFVLSKPGWVVEPEVSFSIYGERGAIDQLAWHEETAHLLVVELKTTLVDVNEMLGTLDRKGRLARTIATQRGRRSAAGARERLADRGGHAHESPPCHRPSRGPAKSAARRRAATPLVPAESVGGHDRAGILAKCQPP
jgi:transcriptional regulator with XRE-family HTH domain